MREPPYLPIGHNSAPAEAPSCDMSALTPKAGDIGYEVGALVWSPCARTGFQRSRLVSVDAACDSFLIEAQEGGESPPGGQERVRRSDLRPLYDNGPDVTFDDNTAMVHLDDANILDNMRRRFVRDEIYTYTANVLLAVNPYKSLEHLYSNANKEAYYQKNIGALPPHPFAIADTAYRNLLRERKNQALVISGESGAGKTETAKITMRYLTSVSRTDAAHGGRIQEKIMNANPILESFGNASTVRNRNSSRFGKYNEMYFNPVGSLVSAGIKTYLLEASRVVTQQEGEQNYHVFYEMLAGLEEDMLDMMQLDPSTPYRLLYNKSEPPAKSDPEDQRRAENFAALRQALVIVGLTEESCQEIWETVAALIHLGQVEFVSCQGRDAESSSANITDEAAGDVRGVGAVEVTRNGSEALDQAADLLGLDSHRLEQLLRSKERHVLHQGGQNRRMSHISCPRSEAQAYQILQSIIKILYKRLFEHIVEQINISSGAGLATSRQRAGEPGPTGESTINHIGTLDIYGFERLQTNSFEQLNINLANEHLQQFFVKEVLDAEQKMYAEERLNVPKVAIRDSEPVMSSIKGIMSILDEHSLRSLRGLCGDADNKDQRFCEAVHRSCIQGGSGPILPIKLRGGRGGDGPGLNDGFQIRHYAGIVEYSTKSWIEKNNDALLPEVEQLLANSTKTLVRGFSNIEAVDARAGERFSSVSSKYLDNLNTLLSTLRTCSVHYIRCFNPNHIRQPGKFDKKYVLDQVIQCGTVELVNIMHHGFPHRCSLQELRERFTSMLPSDFARYSNRDFVLAVMLAFEIDSSQWTLGIQRLFLKAGQLRMLENLRDEGSIASAEVIWKIRMTFARKKVRAARIVIHTVSWLPGFIKQERKSKVYKSFVRCVWICLRMSRWVRTARANLYGIPRDLAPLNLNQAMKQSTRPLDLRQGVWSIRHSGFNNPRLFLTLEAKEDKFTRYLQQDVGSECKLQDNLLKVWQQNMAESILFFDGNSLICARLSPRPFSEWQPLEEPGPTEPCISDICWVDAYDTGRSYSLNHSRRSESDIVCMCQNRRFKHVFATCNKSNDVLIWRWLGHASGDKDKRVIKTLKHFQAEKGAADRVYNMCFLSDVPQRIKSRGGYVLLILSSKGDQPRFFLSAVAVYQDHIHLEDCHVISPNDETLKLFHQQGAEVSFMSMSHSERVLAVGGRGLLCFFGVQEVDGGRLCLYKIANIASEYGDAIMKKGSTMTGCLCLPPPPNAGRAAANMIDWVTVSDSLGNIYGFPFVCSNDGQRILLNERLCGRFRDNMHQLDVPIHVLIGSFGASSQAQHREVQAKEHIYSLYLKTVQEEWESMHSLGYNGQLLSWKYSAHNKGGWYLSNQVHMDLSDAIAQQGEKGGACRFIAGHASSLVPRIMILVDSQNKKFVCHDRSKSDTKSTELRVYSYA